MTKMKEAIKEKYAEALERSKKKESSCCSESESVQPEAIEKGAPANKIVAPSFGSTKNLAEKANIKEGDTVVDFGSGPGHDLFQVAKLTGKTGRVIGIDLTPEMIDHVTEQAKKLSLDHVEVKLGDIENVPLEDNIADVVISNCVINLTSDKEAVFREAFRILKPGGRLVDADIIADNDLPKSLREDPDAWCGCVSGALTEKGYLAAIRKAGFMDISIKIEQSFTSNWKGEEITMHSGIITATKPEQCC